MPTNSSPARPFSRRRSATARAFAIAFAWLALIPWISARPSYAVEAGSPPRVAAQGWTVTAPDGVSVGERIVLNEEVVALLLATKMGDDVRLADFPVAAGQRSEVRLTHGDVYASDATVWRVDGERTTEIPRSRLAFFWGEADDANGSRVLTIVDPDKNTMESFVDTAEGWNVFRPDASAAGDYIVAPSQSFLGEKADLLTRACGEDTLDPVGEPSKPSSSPSGAAPAAGASAITSLHDTTIAVDTDNELMAQKFADDTTTATNYIASLFALVSTIYERDLMVRTKQGTTYLRVSSTSDPWLQSGTGGADSAKLSELQRVWGASYSGVNRADTILLSGKQGSGYSSSGIAYVDTLCSKTYGYAFIQVFKFNGSTAADDVMVTAHEIGHSFGSKHTHCYLTPTPIDTCYSGEGSCWSGATSCPAPQTISGVSNVRGTLMSYCHMLSGCGLSNVFHPRTMDLLDPIIESKVGVCVMPASAPPTPKEASPAGSMKIRKGTGSALTVTYTSGCGATNHTVYAGTLSTLRSQGVVWSQRYCSLGTTGTASLTPATGSLYFVVVANNGSLEGSYGRASSGAERRAAGAGGSCSYTQQLSGSCP